MMFIDMADCAKRAPDRRARTWGRPCIALLALLVLALFLSACGKKGPPEPPGGKPDQFPRQYPDPSSL
jgi:predicted small lipoprotein YifL